MQTQHSPMVAFFTVKLQKQRPSNFTNICQAIADSPFPMINSYDELYDAAKELAGRFNINIHSNVAAKRHMIEVLRQPENKSIVSI